MKKQVKLVISGLVQGVFFRVSTRDRALQLGLDGWVKNVPDGRVATCVSGEIKAVDEFITWCQSGPKKARVNNIPTETGMMRVIMLCDVTITIKPCTHEPHNRSCILQCSIRLTEHTSHTHFSDIT